MTPPDENEERARRAVEAIEQAVDPFQRTRSINHRRVSYVERRPVVRRPASNLFNRRKS